MKNSIATGIIIIALVAVGLVWGTCNNRVKETIKEYQVGIKARDVIQANEKQAIKECVQRYLASSNPHVQQFAVDCFNISF